MKNEKTFIVPGDLGTHFAMFTMSFFIIISVLIIVMIVVMLVSGESILPFWLILSIVFSFGCLLFAYIMQKYLSQGTHKIIVNVSSNTISKRIKNSPDVCYSISDIKKLISTRELMVEDCRCTLNLIMKDGDSAEFLKEYSTPYGWKIFTSRLSKFSQIPLVQETWVFDYNGTKKKVSTDKLSRNRKKGIFTLITPVIIAFLGAKLLELNPSLQAFLLLGGTTILLNFTFYLIFCLREELKFHNFQENKSSKIFTIISLIIPFCLFYMLAVFAVNGLDFLNILM